MSASPERGLRQTNHYAAFSGYRLNGATQLSLLALLAANLLPLVGLLALGWSGFSLIIAYVCETIVIGIFAALKMLIVAQKRGETPWTVLFFCVHYGFFVLIQSIFIFVGGLVSGETGPGYDWGEIPVIVLGFVLSHGISFYLHFIRGKGYDITDQGTEMSKPYVRIVVQQLAVIGGFMLFGIGTLGPALVILTLKAGIDVVQHTREHRNEAALRAKATS